MVTRLSNFFLRTLREDPAEAEVASHRLLIRAGYIRRAAPGVFTWLPLGLKVKARIEAIVREEMANAGAQEVHSPRCFRASPTSCPDAGNRTATGSSAFRTGRARTTFSRRPTKRCSRSS